MFNCNTSSERKKAVLAFLKLKHESLMCVSSLDTSASCKDHGLPDIQTSSLFTVLLVELFSRGQSVQQ